MRHGAAARLGVVVGFLEDDPDQAALVALWLEEAGYTARLYRNMHDFRRNQGAESVDLLLLDWMLPDGSGSEMVEWIRASANATLPIIVLTARDGEDDLVHAFGCGADDYVVKPAKRGELLARLAATLRRHGIDGDAATRVVLGPYVIDARRRKISIDEVEIELTQREFDLANFLFRRHDRIVSRDALLENVWNLSVQVSTRTVDTHISRLRKKLGLNGESGWRLAAVYQHGYRLEQV